MAAPRIGVVGATGAVGAITLERSPSEPTRSARSHQRGRPVRASRSATRSSSSRRRRPRRCRRATSISSSSPSERGEPRARADRLRRRGDLHRQVLRLSPRRRIPARGSGGERCPRALEALDRDRIVANPNCCTIPLTCVLKPLHDAVPETSARRHLPVGVRGRRATDGAAARGAHGRAQPGDGLDVGRRRVRRGIEAPGRDPQDPRVARLAISATCVRVPVLVGHSEAIWLEFEERLSPGDATAILSEAPGVSVLRLPEFPTPKDAAGGDDVLVGRIRGRGLP